MERRLVVGPSRAAPGAPPLSAFCGAFGVTVPFTDEELAELYPSHARFVFEYFLAALALLRAAERSDVGK